MDGKAHNLFGDGFGIWVAKDRAQTGPVFGSVGKYSYSGLSCVAVQMCSLTDVQITSQVLEYSLIRKLSPKGIMLTIDMPTQGMHTLGRE